MIERAVRKNLYAIAKTYAKAKRMRISAVSREFYGKTDFFDDFKRGRQSIILKNVDRVIREFSDRWPPGVEWPPMEPISMARPGRETNL